MAQLKSKRQTSAEHLTLNTQGEKMTESKMLVDDKSVVTPGEVIAEGMEFFPGVGTYRHEDKILANQLGLLTVEGKVLKTTPLAGRYLPSRNDVVIGRVIDILMSGWRIDMHCPYSAVLPLKDATFDFIKKAFCIFLFQVHLSLII